MKLLCIQKRDKNRAAGYNLTLMIQLFITTEIITILCFMARQQLSLYKVDNGRYTQIEKTETYAKKLATICQLMQMKTRLWPNPLEKMKEISRQ